MFNSKDASSDAADTIISSAVKVEGDLVSDGNIIVDGKVNGTVSTKANLIVGDKASISANIKAMNAKIAGRIKGNLEITEKLELTATSKIDGDVMVRTLVMAEGAQLNGKLQMSHLEKVERSEATTVINKLNKKTVAPIV